MRHFSRVRKIAAVRLLSSDPKTVFSESETDCGTILFSENTPAERTLKIRMPESRTP